MKMMSKDQKTLTESSKVEVGEIDTSAPFQSVKDAVNLFGKGTFPRGKSVINKTKSNSSERVSSTHKFTEQLKKAETSKAEALAELESAKKTVEDLTQKLKIIDESTKGIFVISHEDESLKREIESTKQELKSLKEDYDLSYEAKLAAEKIVIETNKIINENTERAHKISKEIFAIKELKDEAKIYREKEGKYKDEVKKLRDMKLDLVSEFTGTLKADVANTMSEIESVKLEVENVKKERDLHVTLIEETKVLEAMKKETEELKKETEYYRNLLEESEKKLKAVLIEVEEVKESEQRVFEELSGTHVRITREEYEELTKKANEFEEIEVMRKEIDEMKKATKVAVKKAEMAEAAKKAVESELRKWREREERKFVEGSFSRVLSETEINNYKILNEMEKPRSSSVKGMEKERRSVSFFEKRKFEKPRSSISRKLSLSNIGNIFHRKRNQVSGGSPSYLPGEKPF